MTKTKSILLVLILLLLILPLFQEISNVFPEGTLKGDFLQMKRDSLTLNSWFSETYQSNEEAYLKNNISFRNFLVRLNNQIDFSFFGITHADGVYVGKNNMLYEYDYIRALNGSDFIGEKAIDRKMRRLKYLQEHLRNNKNTELIIVFEPGKATVHSDYIYEKDLDTTGIQTNYDQLIAKAKHHDVDFLDLDHFFMQIKDTVSYSVYPRYGTHWSNYGMWMALDTMLNYIEYKTPFTFPPVKAKKIDKTRLYRHPDYDIGQTLNLLFQLEPEVTGYPELETIIDKDYSFPDVLTIADSYYWNIYNTGIPSKLFKNHKFWYFCKLVYPDFYDGEKYVDQKYLVPEFENRDIVIIMMTHRFLYKFAWGVIDEIYAKYAPVGLSEYYIRHENIIKESEDWFDTMILKSDTSNIPLDEILRSETEYLTYTSHFNEYLLIKGVEHYRKIIRENTDWYQNVIDKAHKEGRTVDEQLELDARYVFQNKYQDIYRKFEAIQKLMDEYTGNSELMVEVARLAFRYNTTREEMLRIVAEKKVLGNKDLVIIP